MVAVIDVQQLRALVELARLGTVSAAAESLGYSQSAVSHQLAALSRATGAVLLTRAGRGVRLTEEGRALAARGREVIDLLERTEREAVAMAHAEEGRILLAAFPSAVASLVPGILAVVSRRHPGLETTTPVRTWRRSASSTTSSTSSPIPSASRTSPTARSAAG